MIGRWLSVYLPTRLIGREMKRLAYRLENEDDEDESEKNDEKKPFFCLRCYILRRNERTSE